MICVCDIGTSSVKTGIINLQGEPAAFKKTVLSSFQSGFSPISWEQAFYAAAGTFPANLRKEVRAVAISGQGPTLVPLDKSDIAGEPVFWFNRPDSYKTTSYFLPKIAELKNRFPQKYDFTKVFLPCPEYLCFTLTGEKKAVIPHNDYIPYYWSREECGFMEIDSSKLPELSFCSEVFGSLTASAAEKTGLPFQIPVFCTGPDFLAAIIGTLGFETGNIHIRGGTSEAVNAFSLKGIKDNTIFRIVPGFEKETFNIARFLPQIGRIHYLLANELFSQEDGLKRLCFEAMSAAPGARGLKFDMPLLDSVSVSGGLNLESCFSGGAAHPVKQEYARAFLEYAAGQIADACNDITAIGIPITELCVSGGLSKCMAYNILKAACTGIPVKIPAVQDAELLGNAAIAFSGLGLFDTPVAAARVLFKSKQILEPDPVLYAYYKQRK